MSPSRLMAWLSRMPASAVRLELRYENLSGPQTLAGWDRSELDQRDSAEIILQCAQDHAEDMHARCRFEVVWLDDKGRVLGTKGLQVEPSEEEDDGVKDSWAAGDTPKEERTINGIVGQLMRHVENRERMLNIALGTNLKLMADNSRDDRREAATLREENRLLRQLLKEREAENDNAGELLESEARAEALQKMASAVAEHIVPLVATRLREGMQ